MAKEKEKENIIKEDIRPLNITQEMKESYISYAMSVIVSRALPDVRDGLKPVQRRILMTMNEMGLAASSRFRKSAAVVGSVLGQYHPHGDASVYAALARMAQDFSLRYPLVWPQGNFGSLDGDPPAAPRYTECKLSALGQEMLEDIEKETVDFGDNYDGTRQEPLVLPSPVPQLLLNGALGIAVGMATKIPPHNLIEVCDATIHLIDNPKSTVEDICKFIQGPDFPTGGIIYDKKAIVDAYVHGGGPILIKGKAEIVETKRGHQIVISEIPFGVQKMLLLQQIAKYVQDKKLIGIRDIRDESDQDGLRVVIELKNGSQPKKILNFLYKRTYLQSTFHLNMVALVNGIQPKTLSLDEVLGYFIIHRKEVIIRKTKFDKKKAEQREHILKGFDIALRNIDAVIKIIKGSKDKKDAQKNLIKKFKLTKIQADAILEMKLSSLARLERKKIEDELKEIQLKIKRLSAILKSPKKVKDIIKTELNEYKKKFGDNRKTKVFVKKADEISAEDLIPKERTVVTLTQKGLIKRLKPSIYHVQKRGGKGVIGAKTKEDDFVEHIIFVNTHDDMLFFADSGKVFKTKVFEIPEATRIARGKNLMNFLEISSEEKILAVLPLSGTEDKEQCFAMATKKGLVKKTKIIDFTNMRKSGLIAIKLKSGDLLTTVRQCAKNDEVFLATKNGKAIRFKQEHVRPTGRSTAGVKGIRLSKNDEVIGMEIIKSEKQDVKPGAKKIKKRILIVSENGYGKITLASEYRIQKRAGSGIKTAHLTEKTGELVGLKFLDGSEKHLIVISQKGQVIKMNIKDISQMGRATQGVRVIRLDKGDKVASIACI